MGEDTQDEVQDRKKQKKKTREENKPPQKRQLETLIYSDEVLMS